MPTTYPDSIRRDVESLWRYHRVDDELRQVDVAVGLGSHDPGVPVYAAQLYHRGLFPLVVFTGANAATTVERFPDGEAVHFRRIAMDNGVPDDAILTEPRATNTVENIHFTQDVLSAHGTKPKSVLLISRPYQQRRAREIAKRHWPEVDIVCTGAQQDLDTYVASINDPRRVVDMLVGDTQRLDLQGKSGEIAPQEIPQDVRDAFERLVQAGYTSRIIR